MDLNNIKVTVITPTFNDGRYVHQTISSILNQTHKNIELIVVDDCSNDDTVEIVNSFKDERIKLVGNKENKGAAYSRNISLSMATGDYVSFLDGDDIWELDKVEKQLVFMVENNYDFSYTNYGWIDEESNDVGIIKTGPKRVTHKMFKRADYIGCLTVMYKRSIYPNLRIPEDILRRNDYALWLLLSERADCYLLNETLAYYRKKGNGLSSVLKARLFKHHIFLFQKVYGYGKVRAFFCALRNAFYYYVRKMKYAKKRK